MVKNVRDEKDCFFLFLLFSFGFNAQEKKGEIVLKKKYEDYYIITNPDAPVSLDTLVLFPVPKFKTNYDRKYYFWFRKKVYRAYSYAVLAKEKINFLNDTIQKIKSNKKRRRFIKKKQQFFEKQFAKDIKNLTRTEGRILIKLIHRITGSTVNEHVQDKRGKLKAFWYRLSASLFKIYLDLEYHPETVMEDYMIESILQKGFADDELEFHRSVLKSASIVFPKRTIEIIRKK